jgi:GSH-dependent disulfide-bond oxidoreductase
MNTTLYHGEPNGPSLTVLAALFAKQVPAELVRIELARGERHALACAQEPQLVMSVEGEGPVLVVDGEAMTDSVFIACYLDEVGRGAALRPADPYDRWETMKWCRQMIERTAPAAAYLGCRAHPPYVNAELLQRIGSVDLRTRWQEIMAGNFSADHLSDSRNKIRQTVEKIEKRLDGRQWLMGSYSIADLESYAWLAGMLPLVPEAFAERPRTSAWLARVKDSPPVAKALSLARTAEPAESWSVGPEINRWG